MALLKRIPPLSVALQLDMPFQEWGKIWLGKVASNGGIKNPNCFDRKQGMDFGKAVDPIVARLLAVMLGNIPIVPAPGKDKLLPPQSDCVEIGDTRLVGDIRTQNYDIMYRPDGVRIAYDSKTLNDLSSMRKNWHNMINDLISEATTAHTRFPYALALFLVLIPKDIFIGNQTSELIWATENRKKVFLFAPDDVDKNSLALPQREYVAYGEAQGYHKGFKCRNRKRWYIVPQSWRPEAFMLRQIHRYPKIVLNGTAATNTDTLHKIRFKSGVSPEHIAAAFLNSFTFAQCEVTGRSYGGGVMSFEPNEVRKLKIPTNKIDSIDFEQVDRFIREGKLKDALEYVDSITLIDGLGLSKGEVLALREIWLKLSNRRLGRKTERHFSGAGKQTQYHGFRAASP